MHFAASQRKQPHSNSRAESWSQHVPGAQPPCWRCLGVKTKRTRGVTIHFNSDTIRITIHGWRYDTWTILDHCGDSVRYDSMIWNRYSNYLKYINNVLTHFEQERVLGFVLPCCGVSQTVEFHGLPLTLTVYKWNPTDPSGFVGFHLYTIRVTDLYGSD